jgi:hypothetical protein
VSYQLRVIAIDRQRNKRPSFSSIPHDGVADAFLGTTTGLALDQTITLTMPFSAQRVCLLGGPTTGRSPKSTLLSTTRSSLPTPRMQPRHQERAFCPDGETSGAVVEIKGAVAEPFIFDGLVAQR